jgi:class 3 adenylate cyclase/predicted ATPase
MGSALFADISGFTALTESLRESLGARQGAEELSRQMGEVFSALVAEVEKYGGSVIGYAGDSMLCWFDRGNDELQASSSFALSAALGMQNVMKAFPTLALKVSIATGPARRLVVGNETIQWLDVLAGATIARATVGELLATKGEILVDETTTKLLGDSLLVKEWRDDGGEMFSLVEKPSTISEQPSAQIEDVASLVTDNSVLRPFIHHAVYEREISGQGSFLTEFRPCVALFIRFSGLDYEGDGENTRLDEFVQTVQRVVERYQGTLLQITIGDKGSYAYVNFGALSAHEDDSKRAVKAALEIRNKTELQLQIGISQGIMRVGAYGGETRKTFGALGDDVNLAARLMTNAVTDEILLSSHVYKAVRNDFICEPRQPLPMKGKAEPLPVFAVTGEHKQRAIRLQEPTYALPMVGRKVELRLIEDKLDLAAEGKSQVVAVIAEAGLGKSRLVAEVIRAARKKGFVGYGGACQSDAMHTPYQAWKSIWSAFFEVDHEMSLKKQVRFIEGEIEDRAPSRVDAMPLLNVVLDLNIPENDFTKNLEPKIRQSALHALLEDCLKAQARDEPTLIVIEDLHWIDALSHDLLEGLAKALAGHAVCFVLAYRPPQLQRLEAPRLETLPQFTRVELHELTVAEAESAVRAKLLQLYPARGGALPAGLVEALMRRAQGNPFYLEELLNYVRDRGLDPSDIQNIELPDSLHTLILSRIDQLSEHEKTTLRVASIVGRLFRAKWLTGYYPELGSFPQVKAALDALSGLDITPLDSPEPELAYLFKHIVTHEVTYESLPFATRAKLHEQLARYLESIVAASHELPLLDTIAYHYLRSENKEKQIEYLRKAGEAAQKDYANDAALEYYGSLLPLLKDDKEITQIHLKRGQVYKVIGKWDQAETDYRAALESAVDDMALKADAQYALSALKFDRGEYASAFDWIEQAKEIRTTLGDTAGLAQVLIGIGMVMRQKGDNRLARQLTNEGLVLAREAGDKVYTADALTALGLIETDQGNYAAAWALQDECLTLRRETGDKVAIGLALLNLGFVAYCQGDYTAAQTLFEESLIQKRETGQKGGIALALNNLGMTAAAQGDYVAARALCEESLTLQREIGAREGIANTLNSLGSIALFDYDDYATARALYEESLALQREIGDKRGIAVSLNDLGAVAETQGDHTAARALFEESLALQRDMGGKRDVAFALLNLGVIAFALRDFVNARLFCEEALALMREMGRRIGIGVSLWRLGFIALEEGNYQSARSYLEDSLSAYQGLDIIDAHVAASLLSIGILDLAEKNFAARAHILQSLRMRAETGNQLERTSSLIGVAGLVLQEGNPQFAAQLLGAVESALKGLNAVKEHEVKFFYERTLAQVKEALGEAAFQSAWEEGSQWSLEEMVKRVLGE